MITEHERSIYTQQRVAIALSGVPVMQVPGGKDWFAVEGIIIIFCQLNRQPWSLVSAEVYGSKLKRGGGHLPTKVQHVYWPSDEMPQWVSDKIGEYHPLDYV
jgi:hypothetical protein